MLYLLFFGRLFFERWTLRQQNDHGRFEKVTMYSASDPGPGKLTLTSQLMSSLVIQVQETYFNKSANVIASHPGPGNLL